MLPVVKGDLSCRAWGWERNREGWTWLKIALAEASLGKAKENVEEQQELVPWREAPYHTNGIHPDPFLPHKHFSPYFPSLTDLVFSVLFTAVGEKQQLIRSS